MIAQRAGLALVWSWLDEVADPEIPVLSVVDLGIVRDVAWVRRDGGNTGDRDADSGVDGDSDVDRHRDINASSYSHGSGNGNSNSNSDGDKGVADADATVILKVTVTPTYSGCPATRVIERDITRALREHGVERIVLEVRLAPPWTTDWLSDAGRDKLRTYGISPPARGGTSALASRAAGVLASRGTGVLDLTAILEPGVACPRCFSVDVELTSRFGSTPCKALYRCNACREPFDHFKCH